jgi:hypothetical protein
VALDLLPAVDVVAAVSLEDDVIAEAAHRLRVPRVVDGAQGPVVVIDGHEVVNFASNDYLGSAAIPGWCVQLPLRSTRTAPGSGLPSGRDPTRRDAARHLAAPKESDLGHLRNDELHQCFVALSVASVAATARRTAGSGSACRPVIRSATPAASYWNRHLTRGRLDKGWARSVPAAW